MDIVDVFLGRAKARDMCGDLLPQIDKATIQSLERTINDIIAKKSAQLGLEMSTLEDMVVKIKSLQDQIDTLKN